jgi:hypothetical protein
MCSFHHLLARCRILLSALWDAAFDLGLVNFADDGAVLASPQLREAARKILGVDASLPLRGLRDAHRANLGMHRARVDFRRGFKAAYDYRQLSVRRLERERRRRKR